MIGMKLHKKSEKLVYYSISQFNKISYGTFSVILLIGLFSLPRATIFSMSSFIPLLFLLISLVGLGYRERWEFDAIQKEVRSIHGVFFVVKRERIPFTTIRNLEINHFTRGYQQQVSKTGDRGRNKSMTVFSMRLTDDAVKQIEIIPERVSHGKTHQVAQEIALLMNLPFVEDRSFDSINNVELSDI